MKVLYDLQAYSFSAHGGVVRIFDETFQRLADRKGYRPVLYPSAPMRRKPLASAGARWAGFPPLPASLRQSRALSFVHRAAEALSWRSRGLDMIHPTFYPQRDPWASIPAVVHVYDLIHEHIPQADDMPDREAFLALKKHWLTRADQLICISEATKEDLLSAYTLDASRVRVVHPGYNESFRPMAPDEAARVASAVWPDPSKPFLLYVGGRARYKNFHRLVQAYERWNQARNISLVVVGAPRQQSDAITLDLCEDPRGIHWAGPVSDEVLRALYSLAAALVYPSLKEGFGIPLLEAGQSGCPLCISNIAPFREVAGDRAVYFDPLNIESIIDALDRVVASDRATVRGPAVSPFTWDACAEGIWKTYQEVAARHA